KTTNSDPESVLYMAILRRDGESLVMQVALKQDGLNFTLEDLCYSTDVFALNFEIREMNITHHRINTGDTRTICQRHRQMPRQESNSPWSSPVVLVKKDVSTLFLVDYIKLK
ncbi:hypothetical protein J6590_094450, partial [Homalodisca vitripennis]